MLCEIRAGSIPLVAVVFLSLTLSVPAAAQTADDVVAKNLEARGGVEKLRSIQTVKITGKLRDPRGIELTLTSWAKRPNKIRRDVKLPDRTLTTAFDGTSVWGLDSSTGTVQPIVGAQAESTREQANFDPPFLDYKSRGDRIELVGVESIGEARVHHLRVTRRKGHVEDHYISVDSGLELRTVQTFDQAGMKVEIRTELSNYQIVDGMPVAFSMKQFQNGNLAVQVHLGTVEFNVPIDDEIFRVTK